MLELASFAAEPRAHDALDRELFGLYLVDTKARRKVAPPCPVCGRRGYHVRHCERVALVGARTPLIDEFALRWIYVARLIWSHGPPRACTSSSSVRVLTKGGRVVTT